VIRETTEARVLQLLGKTNQFNLTTRRHSRTDLRQLLNRDGWRCYTVDVVDRFGGYGLTAVAIAGERGSHFTIDSLLLSCRVMGRGIETALLCVLCERCRELGLSAVEGEFIPTPKNAPASKFLPEHGFANLGDGRFRLSSDRMKAIRWPTHIQRINLWE
jgi:FkbH-like protein